MLDCGRGLNRSSTVAGSGSFPVVPWYYLWPFVRSWAFVANRVITDTRFWYKNRDIIAENHFQKRILERHIMYYVQRLQIANFAA